MQLVASSKRNSSYSSTELWPINRWSIPSVSEVADEVRVQSPSVTVDESSPDKRGTVGGVVGRKRFTELERLT